jgi:hypothetical protein
MPKAKTRKLHKNIQIAFRNLHQRGALLCRQFSQSEDAVKHGGNYIYFTVKDNVPFPTWAGRFLIENSLVQPGGDGLFEETPQTFVAVPRETFYAFKARYEAPANG